MLWKARALLIITSWVGSALLLSLSQRSDLLG